MIQGTSSQDVLLEKAKRSPLGLKLLGIVSIITVMGFVAYPSIVTWSNSDKSVDLSRIRIAAVSRGDFVRDIALSGNIVAANSPRLYAPAVGTVTIQVNPGELVKVGELLATVSSPTLTNRLQQEQAQLESLAIELERQKIASKQAGIKSHQQIQLDKVILDAAQREKRRAEQSLKIQALSQIDFETAMDDLKRSQLKYDFALEQAELDKENWVFELQTRESTLSQFQLQVDNTKRLVSELDILAPVSGIVGSWSVEQKSAVSQNQPLLTVVDLSAYQIEVDIPESYVDSLGIGMNVNVTYNNVEYAATVLTISPEVSNSVVKGRVGFSENPPPGIKQNQRVSTRVILEQKKDVLYLPRGSFVQHHAGLRVFVVKDNIATLTKVDLGSYSIDKIEVVSGLTEGQQVIISNTDFVGDASVLTIN